MGFMQILYLFFIFGGIIFTAGGFIVQPRSQAPLFYIIGITALIIGIVSAYFIESAPIKAAAKKRAELQKKRQEEEDEQKRLSTLRGLEKYHDMDEADARDYQEGLAAMRKVGMLMEECVYQEKEKDWAVLGGIADGIAGPIAGVATAAKAMQDNVRIRAENEARKEWGRQQNLYISNLAAQAAAKRPRALSMEQLQKLYRADFWKKPADFMKMLIVKTENIKPDPETNAVTVEASWACNDDISIDGFIRALLYDDEDVYLGCAYLALPKAGTSAKSGYLRGICANPASQKVAKVKYEAVSLWELASVNAPESVQKCDPQEEEKYLQKREDQLQQELEKGIAKHTALRKAAQEAEAKRVKKNRIKLLGILVGVAAVVVAIVFVLGLLKNGKQGRIAEEYNAACAEALQVMFADHDVITDVECSVISVEKVKGSSGWYTASVQVELTTNGEDLDAFMAHSIARALPEDFYTSNDKFVECTNYNALSDYYGEDMLYLYVDGELVSEPQKIK